MVKNFVAYNKKTTNMINENNCHSFQTYLVVLAVETNTFFETPHATYTTMNAAPLVLKINITFIFQRDKFGNWI